MEDIKTDVRIIWIGIIVYFAYLITWRLLQHDAVLEITKEQMCRRTFHSASIPIGQLVLGIRVEEAERDYQRGCVIN